MRNTEAWWCCNTCNIALIKPGKKGVKQAMLDHRKVCYEIATFSLKQIEQGSK